MVIKEKKLTRRDKVFVQEYLVDLNVERAALAAGYKKSVANSKAYMWVSDSKKNEKPLVRAEIERLMEERSKRTGITADRVLAEYAKLAFLDIRRAYDVDGNLKPIHELDDETAAAIAGLDTEVIFDGHGGDRERVGTLKKIKLSDKKGALDSIARHLGMFNDKIQLEDVTGLAEKMKERRNRARNKIE